MTPPPKKITIYLVHSKMLYVTPYFLSSRKSDSLSQFKKKRCSSSFNAKMCSLSFQPAVANRLYFKLFLLSDLNTCTIKGLAIKRMPFLWLYARSVLLSSHTFKSYFFLCASRLVDAALLVARSLRSQKKNMNKNNLWHLGQ